MIEYLLYALLGVITGMLAGLFGIGGGLVLVPVLYQTFLQQGFSPALLMHLALGTSLAIIVVTAVSAVIAQQRRGAIRWDWLRVLLPGVVIGAMFGTLLAGELSSVWLRGVFGFFECLIALYLWFDAPFRAPERPPGGLSRHLIAGVIGVMSALLGIGGGTLSVPFLASCRLAMVQAVATASALGLPIAVSASLTYIITGWGVAGLPPGALGYVYPHAMLPIAIGSLIAAPLGVRLAHRLPGKTLRRLFAALLLAVGVRMLTV